MISVIVRFVFLAIAIPGSGVAASSSSIDTGAKSRTTQGTASRDNRTSAKGILPDPTLLDGSAMAAEKRPEQGMLGDFELPGDENSRSGRVGGGQTPPPQQGGQGGQQGMPQMAGGAEGQPAGAGGQKPPENPNSGGGALGGPNDPNAKAEGMQVGQLTGEAGPGGPEGVASKPQAVSIGDSAMQIKTVANAPGVVGAAVPAGQTQQMEKKVGGGRGSTSVPGGRNAAEKGRAIPAGL